MTAPAPARILTRAEAALPLPESRRVKLLKLRPGICKWPIGEIDSPDFCFCGADTAGPETVYCPTHRRLGITPRSIQEGGGKP